MSLLDYITLVLVLGAQTLVKGIEAWSESVPLSGVSFVATSFTPGRTAKK